jgi:hypothetical protein
MIAFHIEAAKDPADLTQLMASRTKSAQQSPIKCTSLRLKV